MRLIHKGSEPGISTSQIDTVKNSDELSEGRKVFYSGEVDLLEKWGPHRVLIRELAGTKVMLEKQWWLQCGKGRAPLVDLESRACGIGMVGIKEMIIKYKCITINELLESNLNSTKQLTQRTIMLHQ
ncbi:uncharacterized protein LOC113356326 [Papaver somniferum]|uniref:uncharacterized protein LOC113356326 n=1 Tax=Papaver somniferum TaxID=3469 RepID=UPI000E701696|nr:uncharacterized protein LOC113356326 [Papaver somniferum]